MAKVVCESKLNASTIDILNTIRANASYEYQNLVPKVEVELDIPRVGEVLVGYPALANQFLNALLNRIALVRIKSSTFNNDYKELKKGYLEFGETVEEVFVNISKARSFSAEKAASREFQRSLPDVRSAFHVMNWRVQYPVTIQDIDLKRAFLSMDGVQDMIARIVDAVYQANEYDEYLLFKYLMIKAVSHGKMYPVAVDTTTFNNAAIAFRGNSNAVTFMSQKYNAAGVYNNTPKNDQFIFMDAMFNAKFDVDTLSAAFNMDKANFMGHLKLIDDWHTFDNDRFSEIMKESDQIEPVTAEELALMPDVLAVLVDRDWFQIYDNENKFTETYVASGLYWNYFYNVWKTISTSPFANAIVFVNNTASITPPETITAEVTDKSIAENGTVLVLTPQTDNPNLASQQFIFVQTESAVKAGVAVQRYGAVLFPPNATGVELAINLNGAIYTTGAEALVTPDAEVGSTVTFTPAAGMSARAKAISNKAKA